MGICLFFMKNSSAPKKKTILTYITKIFLYAFLSSFSCFLSLAFSHFCVEIFRFSKYLLALRSADAEGKKEIERKSCRFHRKIFFQRVKMRWEVGESAHAGKVTNSKYSTSKLLTLGLTWLWDVKSKSRGCLFVCWDKLRYLRFVSIKL